VLAVVGKGGGRKEWSAGFVDWDGEGEGWLVEIHASGPGRGGGFFCWVESSRGVVVVVVVVVVVGGGVGGDEVRVMWSREDRSSRSSRRVS